MKEIKDDQTISWLLMQLMFQNKHRLAELSERHEITGMQSATLRMLSKDDPKAMRTLSDYFMCDASTVTGIVDRLEARHLIRRSNHATDRRVKLLTLTDEGERVKQSVLADTLRAETERLNTLLSKEEREVLRKILMRIVEE
jgi:DNA-binding MarR family transcriptional regulator